MEVSRRTYRIGDLGIEIEIADIAVAVAKPADHAARHPAATPAVKLIKIGRARLARKAKLECRCRVGFISGNRRQIEIDEAALVVRRIESGSRCIVRRTHRAAVIRLHVTCVHPDCVIAQTQFARPVLRPSRIPLDESTEAIPLATIDIHERIGAHRHAACNRRPPVVEAHQIQLIPDPKDVATLERDGSLERISAGIRAGVHRHAASGRAALVIEEIHLVIDVLPEGMGIELAPAIGAFIAAVDGT